MKFRAFVAVLLIVAVLVIDTESARKKGTKKLKGSSKKSGRGRTVEKKHLAPGDHCTRGLAGPETLEAYSTEIVFICPKGTICDGGACNCQDLKDGTIMGLSGKKCRRVAGQKCFSNNQCFDGVSCKQGKCTCPPSMKPCIRENIPKIVWA